MSAVAALKTPAQVMKVEKVKEHIGAIVTGIDLAQPIDGATRKKLYDAAVDNVVLVIRGQEHLSRRSEKSPDRDHSRSRDEPPLSHAGQDGVGLSEGQP